MGFFIDDGMTLSADVAPRPGVHPGFKFRYRPALTLRAYEWREADKSTPAKTLEADVKLLKDQIVDWTIPEPLDLANLKRLPMPDIQTMCFNVMRYFNSEQTESEKNSLSASA